MKTRIIIQFTIDDEVSTLTQLQSILNRIPNFVRKEKGILEVIKAEQV